MSEAEVAALKRLVYARGTADDERQRAGERLRELDVERESADEAAMDARSEAAARTAVARRRRFHVRRPVAVTAGVLAVAALAGVGIAAAAPGGTFAEVSAVAGPGSAAATDDLTRGAARPSDGSAEGSSSHPSPASPSDAADSSARGTGAAGATGLGAAASKATGFDLQQGSSADQSPAFIFGAPQTAADRPGVDIPPGTVASSYRLLSRAQYTPGSAFAAMSPEGRICLVVFGGGSDYGMTCQGVALTLTRGLTANLTTVTVLNPRSGSTKVAGVRFEALWAVDGSFELSAVLPGMTGHPSAAEPPG